MPQRRACELEKTLAWKRIGWRLESRLRGRLEIQFQIVSRVFRTRCCETLNSKRMRSEGSCAQLLSLRAIPHVRVRRSSKNAKPCSRYGCDSPAGLRRCEQT